MTLRSRATAGELEHLAAEARYYRQRYDLYRARIYGGRPTSETRLRELQRLCESAEARYAAAKVTRTPPRSGAAAKVTRTPS